LLLGATVIPRHSLLSPAMSKTVVVLGATGFTGQIVATYLATHPERSKFKVILAGRNQEKLDAIISSVPPDSNFQTVKANVNSEEEVENVVKMANVVINTVGPFWFHGTPVIKACAKHGVHYVDITGEYYWVYKMIRECVFFCANFCFL
jgi:short subunit dehydrogenase-like uncharacterized protein